MRLAVLSLLVIVAACHVRPVPFGTDSALGRSKTKGPEYAEKVVNMKRSPVTLIARDGSRCTVDETTFRDTRVGETAVCTWLHEP
jgi:hypothetical protein